ncbi:MAG: outer membrane lipoprotein carrier protein LolA [Deltaproteobacteria bacterium]|nr:outer membrane lipoprotein carrier protein LolA [Deltaproteobacteria bacterium]MBW2238558.1 outer membrane lipoprotein carrier protein LolA [Deltaproteobacteria bacterium]MBW2572520.1 outer membrane lipoprotein carrier protein LolA [Deltaproteobacteria bacterium]MBW2669802.1 outer membrane lipoprotein carrier protein LolA [Deltaproteobacteria bacterium]
MKFKLTVWLVFVFLFFYGSAELFQNVSAQPPSRVEDSRLSLDDIIEKIEKRYSVPGFSAQFFQTSTIKAMEITDSASGKAFFKRPGKMRWEYETPDRQIIMTDNETLWIFRPEDNQVMIGKAPSFFEGGKGFSFLSDMKLIKNKFSIALEKKTGNDYYKLKLLPREKAFDVSVIYLSVSTKTFDVVKIVTVNSYGDETLIVFRDIQFRKKIDDSMFSFKLPEGVEVLNLDE